MYVLNRCLNNALFCSIVQREDALKKSEAMLEEDALRFDSFLKENDEKVQEAIKKAEVEAKAKQDKVRNATPGRQYFNFCKRRSQEEALGEDSPVVCS